MTSCATNQLIFRVTKLAVKAYCHMGVRITVDGLHHVPRQGGAILVANHRSMLDGPLVYSLMDRMIYSFIKADYFSHSLMRWYLRGGGGIPVKSGGLRLSAIRETHDVLRRGGLLLVFAEGRINDQEEILPFGSAFMKLALKHQVPVVPIVLVGTEEAMPRGEWRWLPRPSQVRVVVKEAISLAPARQTNEQIRASIEAVRRMIRDSWRINALQRPEDWPHHGAGSRFKSACVHSRMSSGHG